MRRRTKHAVALVVALGALGATSSLAPRSAMAGPAHAPSKKKPHERPGGKSAPARAPRAAPAIAEAPATLPSAPAEPRVVRRTLSNGLSVVLSPDPARQSVTVALRITKPEEAGVANAAWSLATRAVGEGGSSRRVARIDRDGVTWVRDVPRHELAEAIGAAAARLARRDVPASELEAARAEAVAELGAASVEDHLEALVFQGYGPYERPLSGTREELASATRDDVAKVLAAAFVPANATLVVAGNFDERAVSTLCDAKLGGLAAGAQAIRAAKLEEQTNQRVAEIVADDVPTTLLYGWPLPHELAADRAKLEIAATLLARGPSSRLGRALGDAATSTEGGVEERGGPGLFWIRVELAAAAEPAAARKEIEAALTSLAKEPVSEGDLARARREAYTDALARTEDPALRAADLARGTGSLASTREALSAVDPASLRDVAARDLGPLKRTVVTSRRSEGSAPRPQRPAQAARTTTAKPEKIEKGTPAKGPKSKPTAKDAPTKPPAEPRSPRHPAKKKGP